MTDENTNIYDRKKARYVDGTLIMKTPEDRRNEDEVAKMIEEFWGCKVGDFGDLAPIDYHFTKEGRLIGVGELKARTHSSNEYPTVYFAVNKWMSLIMAGCGLSVPALFFVRFTNEVRWINTVRVQAAGLVKLAGLKDITFTRTDIEPVIEVPIRAMTILKEKAHGRETKPTDPAGDSGGSA